MGIKQSRTYFTHWNYFLAIERDLDVLSRFIEFSKANNKAYSLEMARIILASASDIDVLLKALCKKVSPSSEASSINKYMEVIQNKIPNIIEFEAGLPRWGLKLTPWINWKDNKVPEWWTACNKVKHHRDEHYHQANLKNTINAVAALYVINLYFYKEQAESGELLPIPLLFRPSDEYSDGSTFNDFEFGINYKL